MTTMAASVGTLVLIIALASRAPSITAQGNNTPVAVQFSAGETFDINNLLQDVGLTGFESATPNDPLVQFTVFNQRSKRFVHLDGNDPSADHVTLLGSVGAGATKLWFNRVVGGGFVNLVPDVKTGVGNGAGANGQLYTSTNLDWLRESTHQYAIRRVEPNPTSGAGLLLQNRGNGLCISLGAKNKDALFVATCSAVDSNQRWQLCQDAATGGTGPLCWPTENDTLQGRSKRSALLPKK